MFLVVRIFSISVFLVFLFIFGEGSAFAKYSYNSDLGDIKKLPNSFNFEKLNECASHKNRQCVRDLGIFYAYKFRLSDGTFSQNIPLAKIWLNYSTAYPSARFLLGIIYLLDDNTHKTGETFLLSACYENDSKACESLYAIYNFEDVKDIDCNNRSCDKFVRVLKKLININSKQFSDDEFEKHNVSYYNMELAKLLIRRGDSQVIYLLEKEVENDAPFASMLLAPLYEKGELVPRNFVRAYMMYDLTGTGYADEKAKLAARMTPEQVREAQEMSWRWQDEHRSYRAGYRGSDMGVQWKLEQR
ncbi:MULTISPECIES: hypothetical protein [unclassified Zymobacter]|uniref:hypothetical protein n=1 Tax=unclassified Zymobacter TaxID=3048685 RepID=UPI0039C0BD1E